MDVASNLRRFALPLTLVRLRRDQRPGDLLIVVQAPPRTGVAQLLPAGATGLTGGNGMLTSTTTHLEGIFAATDIPATILDHLGLKKPDGVNGQPLRRARPTQLFPYGQTPAAEDGRGCRSSRARR